MELLFLALFALSIGSFFNVLILRVPYDKTLMGRSNCPKCNNLISWYDNIPILSWLFLKGKCRNCSKKISIQYPLIEIGTLLIFFIVFYKEDFFQYSIYTPILLSIIFGLFLVLSTIDYHIQAVPDSINLLVLTLAIFTGDISITLENALICAGAFSLLRFYISFIIQKEAMGEGDIIFVASMGAVIGIPDVLLAIFLSSIMALPFAYIAQKKGVVIPYIPFLAISTFIIYLLDFSLEELLFKLYA